MLDHGDIFLGSLPATHRAYLGAILAHARQKYSRLIVPCCGKFGAAEVAVAAGWMPSQIECSDVSLFSTVLAAHIMGVPLQKTFGPITGDGDLDSLNLDDPATVLFALKLAVCRNRAKSFYDICTVRDLERRAAAHIAYLRDGMDKLKARIGGIRYEPKDLFQHLTETLSDPQAVVWCNPPGYKNGYEKMYDTGGVIQFPQVEYTNFDPRKGGYAQVRDLMADAPALGIRLMVDELHDAEEHDEAMCVETNMDSTAVKYLLTNRPQEVSVWRRKSVFLPKPISIEPLDAPIFTDEHEITTDSVVAFTKISEEQAMYYRDLFAHRLGATLSEQHYAFILDGQLAGVVGIHMQSVNLNKPQYNDQLWLEETYGFACPSYRYPRIGRLLMSCITCANFPKLIRFNIHRPVGLITTCLCQHQELKTHRGLFKEISKERQKNGLWKLRSCAYWREETFADVVRNWLAKHGTEEKAKPLARRNHEQKAEREPIAAGA